MNAVFIDGAYLDKVLEINFNMAKIDYSKFAQAITNEDAPQAYYYHCPPYLPRNPTYTEKSRFNKKMGFFKALSELDGFTVRLGRLISRGVNEKTGRPIFVQKKIGVQMAVDVLCVEQDINSFTFVVGDSEYVPLFEELHQQGAIVNLCHGISRQEGSNMAHGTLMESAHNNYEITQDLIDSCLR